MPFVVPESPDCPRLHRGWLERARLFFPLCVKRTKMVEIFLKETETEDYKMVPKLYINRAEAAENLTDPRLTVFRQIFDGLKQAEIDDAPVEYRWSYRQDQWWECKFVGEGVIDQGGGFRDSLCDLAEELCPSDSQRNSALPYFIRCPNRFSTSKSQDTFIVNPGCEDLEALEWLGKLIGACIRTRELLDLPLTEYTWKRILGQRVTWQDYATVDRETVKFFNRLSKCGDKETFDCLMTGHRRTFQSTLTDGRVVDLCPQMAIREVTLENVSEFVDLTINTLIHESDAPTKALRDGVLQVVPAWVLQLLTWQELEMRVCGSPKITVAELKLSAHYEDLDATEQRVEFLWEALERFSNEERSRFLRFVSGRKRLPTPIFLCAEKSDKSTDALPESSTCSNTLFLPDYSSSKICEEKLRYAVQHCQAIDTDVSPWDT